MQHSQSPSTRGPTTRAPSVPVAAASVVVAAAAAAADNDDDTAAADCLMMIVCGIHYSEGLNLSAQNKPALYPTTWYDILRSSVILVSVSLSSYFTRDSWPYQLHSCSAVNMI